MTALKKIALCAVVALAAPLCRAEDAPPAATPLTLDQAEQAARGGDWARARQAYKDQLTHQDASALPASFFFNYGTILAKTGAPAEAYVSLLRAAFAQPFDSDVKHNLRVAEAQVPAAVRAVQPATWLSWWPQALRIFPWKLWILLGLLASAAALALSRLTDRSIPLAAAGLAVALIAGGGLGWSQDRLPVFGATAIAKVKSGPGATFSDITSLEPGNLVAQDGEKDGWLKIRFQKPGVADEIVGWVEPGNVLRVY